jgi:hypothetical protein
MAMASGFHPPIGAVDFLAVSRINRTPMIGQRRGRARENPADGDSKHIAEGGGERADHDTQN